MIVHIFRAYRIACNHIIRWKYMKTALWGFFYVQIIIIIIDRHFEHNCDPITDYDKFDHILFLNNYVFNL